MGQGEVIKFLESCEEPVTRKQIAEGMGEDVIRISHILASLIRWSEIEFIECSGREVKKIAGYSPGRRTRFYFVKREIIK